MEKEKKEIKMSLWTFYVLMTGIVLLITALIIGGLKLYEKNNMPQEVPKTQQQNEESMNVESTKKTQEQTTTAKLESLDINSDLVKKLYEYVNTKYFMPSGDFSIGNGDNWKDAYPAKLFYREKVTNSNIEDDLKILSVCSALYDEKLYTIRKIENKEEMADENIYVFSIANIQNKAKEMFNTTINIIGNSYDWNDGESLKYNAQTNSYEYVQYISGGGTDYIDEFKLLKAEQKGDEIYIYDNYVRGGDIYDVLEDGSTGSGTWGFFYSSDAKIEFAGTQDNFGYDSSFDLLTYLGYKLPVYKHTFKKNTDGTYYWISSELTNKNELKIVE